MTLGVSTLTNQHGDFYGLGDVVIGGYDGAARAAGVYNISGSMESGRGFTINADVFENRTEGPTASVERKLISGLIAASCGDCVGGTFNNFLATRETYQFFDTDTSASAMFNVGKDFTFTGGTFLNSKSTVAAGGNITITADSLKNIGAKSGTVEVTRQYNFEMGTGTTAQFMANVILPYNQRNSAGTGKPNRGNDMKESIDTRPVTRVTGLPDTTVPTNPHKYLIETNRRSPTSSRS